jgi:hypothetical protein
MADTFEMPDDRDASVLLNTLYESLASSRDNDVDVP